MVLVLVTLGLAAPVVRFAIIGDRTGGHQPGVYEGIVAEVERMRPDFAFTVGDQIEGYIEDTTVLGEEWREYRSIVVGLSAPLYLIPGNHDITTDGQLASFIKYAGRSYYSIDYQGIHFVVLDASRWESSDKLPPEQLEWLARDLKHAQKARYTIVFYHKPFWDQSTVLGRPDTLHTLFRKYGVDAVFSGHYHQYFSGTYDGIKYTAIGSSGGETSTGPTGIQYHFAWVTVDDKGIDIAPITAGAVRAWDDVTTDDMRVIGQNEQLGLRFPTPFTTTKGPVELVVANRSTTASLNDTLHWDAPAGWTVEPPSAAVAAAAGSEMRVSFAVACSGRLFPAPVATIRLPYAEGKSSPVSKSLRVARVATCSRVDAPVNIDGNLDEKSWQKPETRFIDAEGGPAKTDSSRFYFAHDETNLYVAAVCFDPAVNTIKAQAGEHDAAVYNDDCVGFFFQPDTSRGDIYQIYLNPRGIAFDQKITVSPEGDMSTDIKWNGSYEVSSASGPASWTIEAAIPLAQLGAKAEPGQAWGLNFRRKQPGKKASADWQPISYDPNTFGLLEMR
jgi:predicted phosphodiesterase